MALREPSVASERLGPTGPADGAYFALVSRHPLTSLRNESEFAAAQTVMDRLVMAKALTPGEMLYLDALSDLVAAYEDRHHPIDPPSDGAMLRYLMESREVTRDDLRRKTGIPRRTLSTMLTSDRPLSPPMVAKLVRFFGVDRSIFAGRGDVARRRETCLRPVRSGR
jgi:HTH-type transcriptional regulator / antitoxin HigA